VVRLIQWHFAGRVTKTVLLTRLLPLSFVSLFGALIVAAFLFPTSFDWRVRVISKLTSPHDNPEGCWLASFGIMAAMVLILPFGGYVAQRLRALSPRLASWAGAGFVLGFVLTFLTVALQLAQPVIGLRWLHGLMAGAAAAGFIAGMFCSSACALQAQRRGSSRQVRLSGVLVWSWLSLTLLPVGCLAGIGALKLLGHQAGQVWAEDLRQSFRHTVLWQLAFWEWIGVGLSYVFLGLSVLLLPASCEARSTRSGLASTPGRNQEQTENERTPFLPATCFLNQENQEP
jgi:hypothetical protein